jgi:phasin family protein
MRKSGKAATKGRTGTTNRYQTARTSRTVRAAAANTSERISGPAEDTVRAGLNAAVEGPRQLADQFTQLFSLSGEQGEELAGRSAQSIEAVTQASTVVTRGVQDLSRELMALAQEQIRRNVEALGTLSRCRSIQEFITLQSELLRDNLQHTLEGTRRMAELSTRMADEATQAMALSGRGRPPCFAAFVE